MPRPTDRPTRSQRTRRPLAVALAATLLVVGLAACGGSDDKAAKPGPASPVTLKLLTHDSFALSAGVLAAFTKETGIKVKVLKGQDAGSVVNQAILTKGAPQGDVLFGIDSTFLTRALGADLFVPHTSKALAAVDPSLLLDPKHRVTPVDYGDVCLNYDKAWFADHHVAVPTSLEDLTKPAYKDLLVVENPASSSTGLAFLLSSIDHFGAKGWPAWWTALRANGVQVTDGWTQAYEGAFSGGGESAGTKPLVVSYASSPPVEVLYADPKVDEAPTGVIEAGCYRQVEGAGVLRGTKHATEAGKLIDFLLSERVQSDVSLSMFVYPVVTGTPLPDEFTKYSVIPKQVASLPAKDIDAHRDEWIDQWTDLVVR